VFDILGFGCCELDLGATLDTLLKGAGHELLWILSLRQIAARLGRWLCVAVGVTVGCGCPGYVSQWRARVFLGQHYGAGGRIGDVALSIEVRLDPWMSRPEEHVRY
jgi:hypothetical protein